MILATLKARQSFAEIAALDEDALSLDRAALAMALEEYPDLDIPEYLRKIDVLATRAEVLIGVDRAPVNVIEGINEALFVQEGLRGNSEDYYDPRNSYLNEVLDRKLGIPISLSLLYMEVSKRIGFPIRGVGFPGHFLVKHVAGEKEIIVDPFNLGRILTWNDCQELLDKMYKDTVTMSASLLQAMGKRTILTRMLYNLKGIYTQKEQYLKALSIIEKILMLNPGTPSELRDRGLLYMETSLFAKALADLEAYLSQRIAPDDSTYIKNHIKMLRSIVCATN
ncbi:MAG TPA: transglutaminase-like domain-containing protein [Acidobacteriota bacterium]|nr:transglutaminase-like domain-containing protein [Acidobacteriota bacterium]